MTEIVKFGKYNTSSDETSFIALIEKLNTHKFNVTKKVDDDINLYDI